MKDIKQTTYKVEIRTKFSVNREADIQEAQRKTIALAEFAKSIGLIVEMEGTVLLGKFGY